MQASLLAADAVQEYLVHGTTYVDIAVPSSKLAIECNGPWHYIQVCGLEEGCDGDLLPPGVMRVPSRHLHIREDYSRGCESVYLLPNGRTRSKMQLLADAGWSVLAVPYWVWRDLPDAEARKQYIRQAMP